MSQTEAKSPLVDRNQTASSSPACEALKGNLDATDDASPSFRKKKSWFGSIRDVFQKGALQAKAAVDSFRTDQHKPNM